ncbi:MAG: nuclear transport factor 2 family protein [Alphaproteobacteria bacterium]|nr:nuclear transport factor 2 family protein [Alphaproteobacteria bacterium]
MHRPVTKIIGFAALLLIAAAGVHSEDNAPDVLRALDAKWTAAINAGDAEAVALLFAEDGRIFPSNAPAIAGRPAIRDYADGMSGLMNLNFVTEPDTIIVAASSDLAYLTGRYSLKFGPNDAPVEDVGKYLVVWQKIGDKWQVVVDTFTSDLRR